MDGKDFFQVCGEYQNAKEESKRRTAVSRGYYGLFNHIIGFFSTNGITFSRSAADHKKVVFYLQNTSDSNAQTVGSQVDDLRTERNQADYDMGDMKFNQFTTVLLVKKATVALQDFDGLDKKKLLSEVAAYRKKVGEA